MNLFRILKVKYLKDIYSSAVIGNHQEVKVVYIMNPFESLKWKRLCHYPAIYIIYVVVYYIV